MCCYEDDISDNSIQKIKAIKNMFTEQIKSGFECQRAVVALLMAKIKDEMVQIFIELDRIMDVVSLTLLGPDKLPKLRE